MNRTILLIVGGVVLVVLLGLWGYLLFFNTPKDTPEIFSNFGFGPEDDPSIVVNPEPEETDEEQPLVDVSAKLLQLTTRPVAGYSASSTSTSTPTVIYYGEVGTGHVYEINLGSGEEKRVSNTTIPSAHAMQISKDGRVVVARSGFDNIDDVILGTRTASSSELSLTVLPGTILDYALRDNTLFYLTPAEGGAVARALNTNNLTERDLFTLPFSQVVMVWGETAAATHYVYPKPSYMMESALYKIQNGDLNRMPINGKGLVAEAKEEYVAFTTESFSGYYEGNKISEIYLKILPEKCVFGTNATTSLWCARPIASEISTQEAYPDNWYKGTLNQTDWLWRFDLVSGSAYSLIDLEGESGRMIDVDGFNVTSDEKYLMFINRLDNTLWSYEI